jgi:chromatin assembly factor 1 subunit B
MIKILRGHVADVYDLDWSPQGGYIVSGSIDKSLIIWDVARGCKLQSFQHEKWVQGVSWDPLGEFIFSLSCDRTCQILKKKPRNKRSAGRTPCSTQISFQKFDSFKKLALQSGQGDYQLSVTLMDDNIPCYFRRLSWSPDGEFVLVSSGTKLALFLLIPLSCYRRV